MKGPTFSERSEELRRAAGEAERDLDSAVETLGRAAANELTLGGRLSRDPWGWVLGACFVGLVIGMRHSAER